MLIEARSQRAVLIILAVVVVSLGHREVPVADWRDVREGRGSLDKRPAAPSGYAALDIHHPLLHDALSRNIWPTCIW